MYAFFFCSSSFATLSLSLQDAKRKVKVSNSIPTDVARLQINRDESHKQNTQFKNLYNLLSSYFSLHP